jgi:quercetin dioxygenase-like cupin family protein
VLRIAPRFPFRWPAALAGALVAVGAVAGWAVAGVEDAPTAKRIPLAATKNVRGAEDRRLELSRVVIPAGVELARHHHEGTQIAFMDKGVLHYTVYKGSVTVKRGAPGEEPKVIRKIKAGETGKIRAGQWFVEQPSDHHGAANRGKEKVVVYLANLLRTGAPPSTPG